MYVEFSKDVSNSTLMREVYYVPLVPVDVVDMYSL